MRAPLKMLLLGLLTLLGCERRPTCLCAVDAHCPPGMNCNAATNRCTGPAEHPQVCVSAGAFWMGATTSPRDAHFDAMASEDEAPVAEQWVDTFFLDVNEVTVARYRQCFSARACTLPSMPGPGCNWSTTPTDREDHPMNCLSRAQALAYCQHMGRRLPTEQEWEYAARGPAASRFPWGGEAPSQNDVEKRLCWTGSGTCKVGSFARTLLGRPDPEGLADLAGNVWEITASPHNRYPEFQTPVNFSAPDEYVLRGGSSNNRGADRFRGAFRNYAVSTFPGDKDTGFRCAWTP